MKLLIHDLTAREWEQVAKDYEGWTVISDTGTIRPCVGCFCCWTGGSGECVFKDGYDKMGQLIHEAEEMVVMSRYTYGGFSSFVKNVFDRSLGYVLPEFETAYGEMHHKKRYPEDKAVTFRFRGNGLSEKEKNKARRYVTAVCRNLRGRVKDVIFEEWDAPEEPVNAPCQPVERSGILFVNCSLRGDRSNTGIFLKQLEDDLGHTVENYSLPLDNDFTEIVEAIRRAETVILGIPLYVDGLPASAIRLMEKVKDVGGGNKCRLYAVVNNGLYESRQNRNMVGMIRDFCAENGFIYYGAIAIGAGEVVGTLMRGGKRSLWPARNALLCLNHLAQAIREGRKIKNLYADPYFFPRWLYILIANVNWQRLKRNR